MSIAYYVPLAKARGIVGLHRYALLRGLVGTVYILYALQSILILLSNLKQILVLQVAQMDTSQ